MAHDGVFAYLITASWMSDNSLSMLYLVVSMTVLLAIFLIAYLIVYVSLGLVLKIIRGVFSAKPAQQSALAVKSQARQPEDGIIDAEWTEVD